MNVSKGQKLRAVLFYFFLAVFFCGLPFILAFALSYKFDRRSFKFTKTGIISVRTQPAGASVYLDGAVLQDRTPMSLNELLPGKYGLELRLDGYYPYVREIEVEAGKVSRIEKIILFPLRPDIQQINKERVTFFWADSSRSEVYYVNKDENTVYRSDLLGFKFETLCSFTPINPPPKKWELSHDRSSLLYHNSRQVGIVPLPQGRKTDRLGASIVLNFPSDVINDVFWYADNYHILIICSKRILICEARAGSLPVTLVNLNKRNAAGFYDPHTDSLLFVDSQEAPDGRMYDNVYRMEMRNKVYPFSFSDFITLKGLEQRMNLLDWRSTEKKDEQRR